MSIKEQEIPEFEEDFQEAEACRLQQLSTVELYAYQEMLEEGYENELAFQRIMDARTSTAIDSDLSKALQLLESVEA